MDYSVLRNGLPYTADEIDYLLHRASIKGGRARGEEQRHIYLHLLKPAKRGGEAVRGEDEVISPVNRRDH